MKILYLSCHIVLEFDEFRILNQLGCDVTIIGGYINPKNPHVDTRPPLDINSNLERREKINNLYNTNLKKGISSEWCSFTLNKDVVDDYDVIYVMHRLDWIEKNWNIIKNKIVILRTIGQNLDNNELELKKYVDAGVKVLRYSPKERDLKNYAGEHGLIRFLKYKSDFKIRENKHDCVISFGQNVNQRGNWCGSSIIESVAKTVPFKLYGPNNEFYSFWGGRLSYEQQLEKYATNACYLYTGTFPAQYTLNFIEALMSGIPIVSIGKELSQKLIQPYPFEVPYILDEIDGYYYDDVNDIIKKLRELIDDKDHNQRISQKQIELATNMFSVEKNINQWNTFLNNL